MIFLISSNCGHDGQLHDNWILNVPLVFQITPESAALRTSLGDLRENGLTNSKQQTWLLVRFGSGSQLKMIGFGAYFKLNSAL